MVIFQEMCLLNLYALGIVCQYLQVCKTIFLHFLRQIKDLNAADQRTQSEDVAILFHSVVLIKESLSVNQQDTYLIIYMSWHH